MAFQRMLHAPVRFRKARYTASPARGTGGKELIYLTDSNAHFLAYEPYRRGKIILLPVIPDVDNDLPMLLGHVIDAFLIGDRARDFIVPETGINHKSVRVKFNIVVADFQFIFSCSTKISQF